EPGASNTVKTARQVTLEVLPVEVMNHAKDMVSGPGMRWSNWPSCVAISLGRLPRTRRQTTMKPIVKFACGLVLLAAVSAPSPAQSPAERAPEVKAAVDGVLGLFQQKPVVVLCDQHGLAQEEDFYSALVRDPRFAENVGNVIVEFGGEASQGI